MNSSSVSAKVSVFGLGYVGSVTAACLAERGHHVIGCDVQTRKADQIRAGEAPIGEPGLAELIRTNVAVDRLTGTTDPAEAVRNSDVSLVCVGTPSTASGGLDLRFVETVAGEIAAAVAAKETPHAVIFRSTMLPGSTRRIANEYFGALIESGFASVFFYPEFLRQGSALADFEKPSLAAIGILDENSGTGRVEPLLDDDVAIVSLESAELLKYACNAFHAAKVGFANEIGRIGKAAGIDSAEVMELLCRDERLNISPYYLRPGTPFGGSCLPKDVSALNQFARSHNVAAPALESLLESNQRHLEHLIERVEARGHRDVLLLGIAFKAGTDDLRGSAMLELAAALLLRDFCVRIYDPEVAPANLIGANERFAALKLPQLESLLTVDLGGAIGEDPATIVASKPCARIEEIRPLIKGENHIIDVNGWRDLEALASSYEGICW